MVKGTVMYKSTPASSVLYKLPSTARSINEILPLELVNDCPDVHEISWRRVGVCIVETLKLKVPDEAGLQFRTGFSGTLEFS